jgi:hypothetical protein
VTHIDPAEPAVDPVELIARTLDAVALDAVANRSTPSATVLRSVAGDLLDELLADERTPPPAVERDADAVRIVDEVLVELLGCTAHDDTHHAIAERIVRALLGIPAVTIEHDTGRLSVDWQDTPSHRPRACIVARDLLDDLVERLQPEPSDPVENHATDDALVAELADAIEADRAAAPLVEAAPELTAQTHTIVDEEGVMLDVTTGVSAPYVALITTHYGKTSGPVAGLVAEAARRLAGRLTAAADDAP